MTSAPTTHRKLRPYCWNVCPNHCIATVAAQINCWDGCYLATSSKHSFLYCCVATNRRDVFTSVLRSNERGVTQQRATNTRTSIVAYVFRGFCVSTDPAWGKHATIWFFLISCHFIPLRSKYSFSALFSNTLSTRVSSSLNVRVQASHPRRTTIQGQLRVSRKPEEWVQKNF
jgi:hypothetical protein